jgi:hypothetical protein
MDAGTENTAASYSGSEMIDLLSHHIYPLLIESKHALRSRLVCRKWRDAFSLTRATIARDELERSLSTYQNIFTRVRSLQIDNPTQVDLKAFLNVAPSCPLLSQLDLHLKNMDGGYLDILEDLLNSHLPQLKSFGFRSAEPCSPQTCAEISNALESTKLQLEYLKISCMSLGGDRGAGMILAIRHSRTIKRFSLHVCALTTPSLYALATLLRENTSITRLSLQHNRDLFRDREGSAAFGAALALNSTLQRFSLIECALYHSDVVYPALQSNKTLRNLQIISDLSETNGNPSIFECLESNSSLQRLDISFAGSDATPTSMGRLFERNSTLRDLTLEIYEGETIDFEPMFGGLRRNSSLTALTLAQAKADFAEQLSACMLDNPKLPLKRLLLGPSDDQFKVGSIARVAANSSMIEEFVLYMIEGGPETAAALADLVEKSTSIRRLGLFGHGLSASEIATVLTAVKKSTSLVELDIGGVRYDELAVDHICEMIASNPVLSVLEIEDGSIPIRCRPKFEAALRKNTRMLTLSMRFITDEDFELDKEDAESRWTGNLRLHVF